MSLYTIPTDATDKRLIARLTLHGRPAETFDDAQLAPGTWAVLCLNTATDGKTQTLYVCPSLADYNSAKALAGTYEFFRVPRVLLVSAYPAAQAIFA